MVFTEPVYEVLGKFRNDPAEDHLLIQCIFFGGPQLGGQPYVSTQELASLGAQVMDERQEGVGIQGERSRAGVGRPRSVEIR